MAPSHDIDTSRPMISPWSMVHPGMGEEVPLGPRTTWRIGGPARWLAQPRDAAALIRLLQDVPATMPWMVLGGGSNLLVDDQGFAGLVIDPTRHLTGITLEPASPGAATRILNVGAGARVQAVAHCARRHGLTGAEFLAGIPGSVGGAIRMNAGAYGGDMQGILIAAEAVDPTGQQHHLTPEDLAMGYRTTALPGDWILLSARLQLRPDDPERIRQEMRTLNRRRLASQPLALPSAGSVFRNPPGESAWRLIDAAGMRHMREGNAQVAATHCNFFLNLGQASSADMRRLIDRVRQAVARHCGIQLQLEVKIVHPQGEAREI